MEGIFLDASIMQNKEVDDAVRYNVQHNTIVFEFPQGFTELRLIEECRAIRALDISNDDNFDLMYDITMQMLIGKAVVIKLYDNLGGLHEVGKFIVRDRYMNLRSIDIIDEYPIIMNWLVEFIAGYLGKKYPRSYEDCQARMSERLEHMKSLNKKENQPKVTVNQLG